MNMIQIKAILLGVAVGFALTQNSEAFQAKQGSLTAKQFSELQAIDESWFEADTDPFQNSTVDTKNPINSKNYEQVLTGPAYYARFKSGYDYYRYVTFYNVEVTPERAFEFMMVKQKCHDNFERFAMFEKRVTYKRELKAGVSYEGLGLDVGFTEEETTTLQFNVNAIPGYEADHVAYYRFHHWKGVTVMQTYNSTTRTFGWVQKREREPSISVFSLIFPSLTQSEYPIPFSVKNADREIEDVIVNKRKCDPSEIPPNPRTRNSSAGYESN